MPSLPALRLDTQFHPRVWGGQRLRPATPPIGEAWVVHDENHIVGGPADGRTLAAVAAAHGPALLGRRVTETAGPRFPLLVKLLDTADWLSLQVHPNDEQARRLEGPGHLGKTEAWHILQAEPGARLIHGLRPGVTRERLAAAIQDGTILDLVRYRPVAGGDTLFTPAGTIHALGPGLLLYEVQQSSDLTYRVYDWGRPQSAGRALHLAQSLAVADPAAGGEITPPPAVGDGEAATVVACPQFTLQILGAEGGTVPLDTGGESAHILTVVDGAARVEGRGWSETVGRLETIVVPAVAGQYAIVPEGACRLLKASQD